MSDPWQEFRTGAQVTTEAPANPWDAYTAPGLTTPRAPAELRASPDDKYRAAALADRQRLIDIGFTPPGENYTSRVAQGASLGWLDEIMAAGATPIEMARRRTLDPREGYRYAKAQQDLAAEERAKNTAGVLGTAAEVAGGLVTGAGVLGAGTRVGATRIPFTSRHIPGTLANYGANILKAGGMGSVLGAGEAKDIAGIPSGMVAGGLLGAGVGAAAQPVVAMAAPALRLLTQAPRLRSPENVATEQIAAVARAAGVTPDEIVRRIEAAHAAGQPFNVADAIGHEGQRKLAAMSKVPGDQRQLIVDALQERRTNMPYRVGPEIGRAYGAPGTSEAAREALITRAAAEAAPVYRAAEQVPTWSSRLQQFLDDPIAHAGLRQGVELQRLRTVGTDRPFRPTDAMITNFNEAGEPIYSGVPNMQTLHTLKVGLDRLIQSEINPATGQLNARGNALRTYRDNLLAEIDAINPTYARARAIYADDMQVADAIRQGQQMPTTGRAADNLTTFGAAQPNLQQGMRIGYADQLQRQLEQHGNLPPILREKVPKGMQEVQGMALPDEAARFRDFLRREETMQRGEQAALGGSSTAENIADIATTPSAAADIAIGLAGAAASGSPFTFTQRAMAQLSALAKGESQAQRTAITRALLETNPDMTRQMAERIAAHELRRRGVNPWRPDAPPRYREGE